MNRQGYRRVVYNPLPQPLSSLVNDRIIDELPGKRKGAAKELTLLNIAMTTKEYFQGL